MHSLEVKKHPIIYISFTGILPGNFCNKHFVIIYIYTYIRIYIYIYIYIYTFPSSCERLRGESPTNIEEVNVADNLPRHLKYPLPGLKAVRHSLGTQENLGLVGLGLANPLLCIPNNCRPKDGLSLWWRKTKYLPWNYLRNISYILLNGREL